MAMMVGFGKFYIPAERVIAVLPIGVAVVKRIREAAHYEGKIVDLTYGKRTRSVILMDSGHVILVSMEPQEVAEKLWGEKK